MKPTAERIKKIAERATRKRGNDPATIDRNLYGDTLDELLDDALAAVWLERANPLEVREKLKAALAPFLKKQAK